MMGDAPASEMLGGHNAIEVILVRLEGKMDRIGDRMNAFRLPR